MDRIAKGLEADTFLDFSTVISQEIPDHPNVVLSGPSHAEEVSRGEATTVTVASKDRAAAHQVQDWLMNPDFAFMSMTIWLELNWEVHSRTSCCGGWNRRWCWFGRQCKSSPHDQRNHRDRPSGRGNGRTSGNVCRTFRYRRSGGYLYQHAFQKSKIWNSGRSGSAGTTGTRTGGHGVEGYSCTKVAHDLAEKMGVEMPITSQTYQVLYEGKSPKDAVRDLMGRPKKKEIEHTWVV